MAIVQERFLLLRMSSCSCFSRIEVFIEFVSMRIQLPGRLFGYWAFPVSLWFNLCFFNSRAGGSVHPSAQRHASPRAAEPAHALSPGLGRLWPWGLGGLLAAPWLLKHQLNRWTLYDCRPSVSRHRKHMQKNAKIPAADSYTNMTGVVIRQFESWEQRINTWIYDGSKGNWQKASSQQVLTHEQVCYKVGPQQLQIGW